jgi:1-acyl-sn-glycerol-3-phosphate acyltransferase
MPGPARPTFYPPGDSPTAFALVRRLFGQVRRHWFGIPQIDCPAADFERLARLTARPALICSNHPTLAEPLVVLELLGRLGRRPGFVMDFYTLRRFGPLRPLMQAAGGYSLRRASADRDCFAATRRLLLDGRGAVLFPEGETYGLNDTLLPFHEGVAQMGLWGLADRRKAELEPTVALLPLAIKYYWLGDGRPAIEAALARLERRLKLAPDDSLTRYQRLRRVAWAVMAALEHTEGLHVPAEADLNQHIEALSGRLIERLSRTLEVEPAPGANLQDQLRRLYNVVDERLFESGERDATPYERDLQRQHEPAWRAFERDLARLQCFQAVRDGYVAAHPSAERYLDVLGRLERELLGRDRGYGRRRAVVRVGEPVELQDYWEAYRADRKAALTAITSELRTRLAGLLEELGAAAPVID